MCIPINEIHHLFKFSVTPAHQYACDVELLFTRLYIGYQGLCVSLWKTVYVIIVNFNENFELLIPAEIKVTLYKGRKSTKASKVLNAFNRMYGDTNRLRYY